MSDQKQRKALEIFAGKMEKRLQEKDGKYGVDGWLEYDCDIEYLAAKIDDCSLKITARLRRFSAQPHDARNLSELEKKCIDIANFAMMISDNLRHQSESGRS